MALGLLKTCEKVAIYWYRKQHRIHPSLPCSLNLFHILFVQSGPCLMCCGTFDIELTFFYIQAVQCICLLFSLPCNHAGPGSAFVGADMPLWLGHYLYGAHIYSENGVVVHLTTVTERKSAYVKSAGSYCRLVQGYCTVFAIETSHE